MYGKEDTSLKEKVCISDIFDLYNFNWNLTFKKERIEPLPTPGKLNFPFTWDCLNLPPAFLPLTEPLISITIMNEL